jgi:hypothetical protein
MHVPQYNTETRYLHQGLVCVALAEFGFRWRQWYYEAPNLLVCFIEVAFADRPTQFQLFITQLKGSPNRIRP